jgi:hypothetical protein
MEIVYQDAESHAVFQRQPGSPALCQVLSRVLHERRVWFLWGHAYRIAELMISDPDVDGVQRWTVRFRVEEGEPDADG